MCTAEQERLLQIIHSLSEEEKTEIVKLLPSDLLFDELRRRHDRMKDMVKKIMETTKGVRTEV